jgi:hypothetical protein
MQWTGWDGSRWVLSDPVGNIAMLPGVEGLHEPRYTRFTDEVSSIPGNRIRGVNAQARTVFWPLQFQADDVDDWRARYDGFFDSIDVVNPGVWQVGDGDDARTLKLTGIFDADVAFDYDPFMTGYASFGVTLEAAQPYWEGQSVTAGPWTATTPVGFFPGPTFHISDSSRDFTNASINNPGKIASYVTWACEGEIEAGSTVGVAGKLITIPFDIASGTTLVIQTDPRLQYATLITGAIADIDWTDLGGVDKTRELGFQSFAAAPAGEDVPLQISVTGSGGQVAARLTPLYRRAF